MRSLLAPNFQAFSRASWNVMLSIFASRHLIACACESMRLLCASMCLLCSVMWASICPANWASSAGLSAWRSLVLIACTSSMDRQCAVRPRCKPSVLVRIARGSHCLGLLHARDQSHLLEALPGESEDQRVELILGQRHRRGIGGTTARPFEAALVESACRAPHAESVMHQQLDPVRSCVGEDIAVVGPGGAEDLYDAC